MSRFRGNLSWLLLLAKLAVAAILLTWLFRSGRLQLATLGSIQISGMLAVLGGLLLGSMALPAVRWWWLLRIQDIQESPWKVTALTWAGYFTALVLPGAASGDIARSYLIVRRRDGARARAFSTVLADRFLGLYSLLCLGMFSLFWLFAREEVGPAIAAMAVGTVGLALSMTLGASLLVFAPSRRRLFWLLPISWAQAWNESVVLYRNRGWHLCGCFGLSLVSSAMTIGSFAVAGQVLGESVSWDSAFLAGPLVTVANCLPITPGGIGTAEAASSQAFAGMQTFRGAEMMLLIRVTCAMLALPGAFAAIWIGSERKAYARTASEDSERHCSQEQKHGPEYVTRHTHPRSIMLER